MAENAGSPKALWARPKPERRARKGASMGAAAALLLFMGFMGTQLRTSLSTPVDVLIGVALGILGIKLLAGAIRLATKLLQALPRYLGWGGAGALVAFLLLFLDRLSLPWTLVLFFGVGIVVVEAVLGGALAVATAADFKKASGARKALVLAALVVAVAANIAFFSWLMAPGTDSHLVELHAAPSASVAPLEAPDPSQPGPYPVGKLFYGSGTDKHRPEYGAAVDLKTEPVDATPFVKGLKGWKKKVRRWYWGFGPDAFPLNGRVWFPEGEGPFPLVLVVHGNHHMAEFSDPGYAYLGELLASRGFILVSVDENFLNGSPIGGIPKENDARAWILLQHLKAWQRWNQTLGNPFYKKVDMENIALVGHSRGGEAVGIAGAFNNLSHYPDDATVGFDFGFSIKALIAIAPSDGQYKPADKPVPLQNVNYLVLQGGHDSDVSLFLGDRQFNRVSFTHAQDWFKASLYIYRANHGQFNTVWGRTDYSPPTSWLLNLKPLLEGEEQRRIAKIYFSAFLETTLHADPRYRPLFRDHRVIQAWLPETIYVTRYEDSTLRIVSDYEEDIDVTTTTVRGGSQQAEQLAVWREQDVKLRGGRRREDHAVYLGWRAEGEQLEGQPAEAPSYAISLPRTFAREAQLGPDSLLVFQLAEASEKPPAPDEENAKEEKEEASGGDGEAEKGEAEEEKQPLDFSVELVAGDGSVARLPLGRFAPLPPVLKVRFTKSSQLDEKRYKSSTEPVLQTFELPLSAFVEANARFNPANLQTICFRFDRTQKGVIILDQVGFARQRSIP